MTDKITPDSKALVAVPGRSTEPLAVVPVSQKSRRSELAQRRTRRPFSVSEVEALVQAVEELGTGRFDFLFVAFHKHPLPHLDRKIGLLMCLTYAGGVM